jgi:hypothetical protein
MADEEFKKFKKQYKEGDTKMLANPPPLPGAAGLGRMIGGAVSTAGRKRLMDTLNKSKEKGQKARSAKEGRTGGTFTDKIKDTRTRERTPKEKEKFGPLVKRKDNLPATQGSRAVVKREDRMPAVQGSRALTVVREGKGNLQKYNPGGRSVVSQGTRTFGDKGQSGRIVGLSNKGKLALGGGAAAAAAAGYQVAQKSAAGKTDRESPKAGGGMTYAPRDDRASSGGGTFKPINRDNLSEKGKKTFDGKQGQSKTKKPVVKKDGPKAGPAKMAEKPMSNFERMKKRQYEKEGYGGRSMTSRGAESRVKKERSFKFKDLFAKKK